MCDVRIDQEPGSAGFPLVGFSPSEMELVAEVGEGFAQQGIGTAHVRFYSFACNA